MGNEKEALKGIEKIINFWYRDLDDNYRFELYTASRAHFKKKVNYYVNKGCREELAQRAAVQSVYKEIYNYSNMNH